ncbi:MAG: c-type cytochrome [Candidatus Binatia bacterium]
MSRKSAASALLISLMWTGVGWSSESPNSEAPAPESPRAASPSVAPASIDDGKRVYEREGCAMCHSIDGKGNRRGRLDGVGARLGEDEIRKWIVSPDEMKPGVRKKAYKLSEPDLAALVAYMRSLQP